MLDADLILIDESLQFISDEVLSEDGLLLDVVADDGDMLHEGIGQFFEEFEGEGG